MAAASSLGDDETSEAGDDINFLQSISQLHVACRRRPQIILLLAQLRLQIFQFQLLSIMLPAVVARSTRYQQRARQGANNKMSTKKRTASSQRRRKAFFSLHKGLREYKWIKDGALISDTLLVRKADVVALPGQAKVLVAALVQRDEQGSAAVAKIARDESILHLLLRQHLGYKILT